MRILFSSPEYDRYDPKRGRTFEYYNFYLTLRSFGEVRFLPFDRILEVGRRKWNQELLAEVDSFRPDVFFTVPYTDEFLPEALAEIKKKTVSAAWFSDDSWRFWNYSRFWARYFTWAITTYSYMPELYRKYGQPNVVRSQWAANTGVYKPVALPTGEKRPEVTFVGSWSKPREKIIQALHRSGLPVVVYGGGWPGARRAGDEEMVRIFGQSKISLALNPPPGRWNVNSLGRLVMKRSLNRFAPDPHPLANFRSWLDMNKPQIKGRHFEIPACGGLLFTTMADDLQNFYKPGEEMVIYTDLKDCIEKLRYYLTHDVERERIARAGYERTIREHTYTKRFENIFRKIGLGS